MFEYYYIKNAYLNQGSVVKMPAEANHTFGYFRLTYFGNTV